MGVVETLPFRHRSSSRVRCCPSRLTVLGMDCFFLPSPVVISRSDLFAGLLAHLCLSIDENMHACIHTCTSCVTRVCVYGCVCVCMSVHKHNTRYLSMPPAALHTHTHKYIQNTSTKIHISSSTPSFAHRLCGHAVASIHVHSGCYWIPAKLVL